MFENVDWFSFVVGGIFVSFIVNVFAGLAQPKIRDLLSKFSEKRRSKNQKLKSLFEEEVNRLIDNPHEEVIARLKANSRLVSLVQYNILLIALIVVWTAFKTIDAIAISVPILLIMFGFNVFSDYPRNIHTIVKEVDILKAALSLLF